MHRPAVMRSGDRATLTLGKDILDKLQWAEGTEATVTIDEENRRVIITVGRPSGAWSDEKGIQQLEDWIAAYLESEDRAR